MADSKPVKQEVNSTVILPPLEVVSLSYQDVLGVKVADSDKRTSLPTVSEMIFQ
jgi:hypothetical protein